MFHGPDCPKIRTVCIVAFQVSTTSHKGTLGLFPPGKKNKQRFVVSLCVGLELHVLGCYVPYTNPRSTGGKL